MAKIVVELNEESKLDNLEISYLSSGKTITGKLGDMQVSKISFHDKPRYQALWESEKDYGVLSLISGEEEKFGIRVKLKKGAIHVQLSVLNKLGNVVDNLKDQMKEGRTKLVVNWDSYINAPFNLIDLPKINIGPAVYSLLTKQKIVILAESTEQVYSSIFVLVSIINAPFYRDLTWAINPDQDSDFDIIGVTNDYKYELPKDAMIINLIEVTCEGKTTTITDAIANSLQNPSMEKISGILKAVFGHAQAVMRMESTTEYAKEHKISDSDLEFYLSLRKVFSFQLNK
jgi:hypothetical protein